MGWLNNIAAGVWSVFGADDVKRDPADDFWYGPAGRRSVAGVSVTPLRAMQSAAVYSAVRVLAETVAVLPLAISRRRADGGHEPATDHPLFTLLHDRPNSDQSSFEFREMLQGHLCLRGNAYAEIIPGPRGAVDQLVPLHPDRVAPFRTSSNRLAYRVTAGKGQRLLMAEDVFHLRGMVWDGDLGLDPISQAARDAIGIALGAQEFSGRFLANDGRPGGIIEYQGRFKSQEERREFVRSWQEQQTGLGFGKTAVLQQGMSWKDVGVTNRQSQFLEQRKYSDVEIARIFRVPPHMIAVLDRATFSNIEQQAIDFVVHTILPWVTRWEQAINRHLILRPEIYFAKFNVAGLLRGDLASRYSAYATGRQWGWLSANDVRKLEDMNPIGPGGDVYLSPTNMQPADRVNAPPAGMRLLASAGSDRILRKELGAVSKAYERAAGDLDAFAAEVERIYQDLAVFVGSSMRVGENVATDYAQGRLGQVRAAVDWQRRHGELAIENLVRDWWAAGPDALTQLCLEALSHAD